MTPTLNNVVNIKWAADYGKNWVVGIWLVEKLSSDQLLERLVKKGKRNSEYTRELIKKKLTDDDDGIATTNLKVTVSCPLGKHHTDFKGGTNQGTILIQEKCGCFDLVGRQLVTISSVLTPPSS